MLDKENHLSVGPGAQLSGQDPELPSLGGGHTYGGSTLSWIFPKGICPRGGDGPGGKQQSNQGEEAGAWAPWKVQYWVGAPQRSVLHGRTGSRGWQAGMLAIRGLGECQAAIETPETTDTARPTEV